MEALAVVGSPRKGKSTDRLIDRAIEGVKSSLPDCNVKKLYLGECNINLNAKTIGAIYAGDIEGRGAEYYFDKAFRLGARLG